MITLFTPAESGLRLAGRYWCETRTSDPVALDIFSRHYSNRRWRKRGRGGNYARFIGPGECMVLISPAGDALFAWHKERFRRDSQTGVNCSVFRNESQHQASAMILDAEVLAWRRWPGERLFTFVNPRKVRSSNPGYCFKKAGWTRCGVTKDQGLLIFEKYPEGHHAAC